MRTPDKTLTAFALAAGAAVLATAAAPVAQARTRLPNTTGSYYGNCYSSRSDLWNLELHLTLQSGRRVTGYMNIGGRFGDIRLQGTLLGSNRLRLSGRNRSRAEPVRINIQGRFRDDEESRVATINGTYRLSGSTSEGGSLSASSLRRSSP